MGGISDRHQEIKRRRHRRKKLVKLGKKAKTANASEKAVLVEKLRNMTPGAEVIISNWNLDSSKR